MKTTIPLELVDLEGEGYHLLVLVNINGKPARMVLDTGASRTVFDSNVLNEYTSEQEPKEEERLSTAVGSSNLKSYSIIFENFAIAGLQIKNYVAAVLDLQHISNSYSQIEKGEVHGVLGGDILFEYNALINYREKTLTLFS